MSVVGVVDAVIGAEREAERDALVGAGGGDHGCAGDILGDLDADGAEIAACAHDQDGLAGLQPGAVEQQLPGGRRMAHDHRGLVEAEALGNSDRDGGRHGRQFGKAAGPAHAHHAAPAGIALAVLRAGIERHHAGGGDPVADAPARHVRADRIHDAGAIDAGNDRQRDPLLHLLAGAEGDIEHAIDGRGMHAHADFAAARLRVRNVPVLQDVRRTVAVEDDGLHGNPFSRVTIGGVRPTGMLAAS